MIGGKLIRRLAEYFSDGWRREGLIDSSCLFKIGAEVRAVRWKISNNTHPVPVLNNTHPFPSKCSVDALCRVRESAAFATQRSRVRIPSGPRKHKEDAVQSSNPMTEQRPLLFPENIISKINTEFSYYENSVFTSGNGTITGTPP